MKLHANAALTVQQRKEVKRLYEQGKAVKALAERFGVGQTTIRRWIKREEPYDQVKQPAQCYRVVTTDYCEAVVAYRTNHPEQGALRIAQALLAAYPQAHRGTVQIILQQAELTRRRLKKSAGSRSR